MSNWEYKAISSGKGGFATPALMEKFLNDLGQEEWEIVEFRTPPDNPLAFSGLARRPTQRDWTLQDAAAAAARAEADKLRAEFEAKFKAATSNGPASADDKAETFLAEEKVGTDDGLRRMRDTSRDDDRDAPDEENGEKDDWDKLAEEDELPTFFDALKPHMRRNQRGPGMSVGVDFLAKKWRLEESDIKGALVECGLQIPADENAKPVYVEYDGDLYWVNINRRGEIWINTREKPEPVFRVVQGRRLTEEESSATEATQGGGAPREQQPRREQAPAQENKPAEQRRQDSGHAPQQSQQPAGPKTLLDKVRGLMRRNRRGHGWSGSFGFLTKALKTDEAGLLAQLAEHGVTMAPEGSDKPVFHQEGDFLYWMNKNQRGEIWINARKERRGGGGPESEEADGEGNGHDAAPGEGPAESVATSAPAPAVPESMASEVVPEPSPASQTVEPLPPPENTLSAVRLLLEPKKRGEGVAALVSNLARQLGRTEETLLAALVAAGLNVPEDGKTKPTFGENAGEIFWLNRSTKGDLWLNAKTSKAKKARGKKSEDEGETESE